MTQMFSCSDSVLIAEERNNKWKVSQWFFIAGTDAIS